MTSDKDHVTGAKDHVTDDEDHVIYDIPPTYDSDDYEEIPDVPARVYKISDNMRQQLQSCDKHSADLNVL